MKTALTLALALTLATVAGCAHTFATPLIGTYTLAGETQDVVWMLEDDGHHIVRCVEAPQGPTCIRASFD